MRGPQPTPTPILKLRGSPLAKTRKNEPRPQAGVPPMPRGMSAEAKKQWRYIVPILEAMGVLAICDQAVLVDYCESWSDYWIAKRVLKKDGPVIRGGAGGLIKHPAAMVIHDAHRRMMDCCARLGLSASDRARLKVIPPAKAEPKDGKSYFPKRSS